MAAAPNFGCDRNAATSVASSRASGVGSSNSSSARAVVASTSTSRSLCIAASRMWLPSTSQNFWRVRKVLVIALVYSPSGP